MDEPHAVDFWSKPSLSQTDLVQVGASFARRRLRAMLIARDGRRSPMTAKYIREDDYATFFQTDNASEPKSIIGPTHFSERLAHLGLNKTYVQSFRPRNEYHHHVERWVESPLEFSRRLWRGIVRDNDIQFLYYRSICREFKIPYNAETAGAFYALGRKLNSSVDDPAWAAENYRPLHFVHEVRQPLLEVTSQANVDAFLECCFSNHLFEVLLDDGKGHCCVRPRGRADAEFLLGNLFSVPTASSGLNQLFGGSGPMMTMTEQNANANAMPGRVMLASGRFGSGKSVFAQLLACEVARKGGVAWYFSTEQTVSEVLYTLKTVTSEPSNGLHIITKVGEAIEYINNDRRKDEGVLVVLNMCDVNEENAWDYLKYHSRVVGQNDKEPALRLAVIDSINAIPHHGEMEPHSLRQSIFEGLEECTENGMNVLLLEELTDHTSRNDYRFVRNLADCVIELSIESPSDAAAHGYARRYIEILKSRFQRDQRGRHSFSILPPGGFRVVPSTAAVRARVGSRRIESREHPEGIGNAALDEILGNPTLFSGELNVLRGDSGTFKTALAAGFLNEMTRSQTSTESTNRRIGLLVSMRMGERDFCKPLSAVSKVVENSSLKDRIQVCRLPSGFVTPGEVLRLIEKEIVSARFHNRTISRVVLDDVGEWPSFSPFIRDDASFGPTLLDFLSRYPLLVMATLNDSGTQRDGGLQEFFVENASRLIDLERFVHGGRQRALLRVINSPRMTHKRDAFELRIDHFGRLQIDTRPSLFEVSGGKKHSTAGVQLYLQAESLQQQTYNDRIRDHLRAMMSPDVQIENPDHLGGVGNVSELGLSVVTTLQVLQIDGFRLHQSSPDGKLPRLHELDLHPSAINHRAGAKAKGTSSAFLKRLNGRMCNSKQQVVAVPYYDNLSFLVGNCEQIDKAKSGFDDLTWEAIAEGCDLVSSDTADSPRLFFDFPQGSDENLNCLFLEILFQQHASSIASLSQLRDLLLSEMGLSTTALFHRIAQPAFQYHGRLEQCPDWCDRETHHTNRRDVNGPRRYSVCTDAAVWRHWFTTFNQMMTFGGVSTSARFDGSTLIDSDAIRLRALPGNWTTTGEWYLCIPEHSAVPAAGNSIIELLIEGSADRERFDLGVGLPVRSATYDGETSVIDTTGSTSATELTLDFFQSLQATPTIRRDEIKGYPKLSPFLANWLRRVLRVKHFSAGSTTSETLMRVLERIFDRTESVRDETWP